MKKADNFNASKWLVENKITTQSRLTEAEKLIYVEWDELEKMAFAAISAYNKQNGLDPIQSVRVTSSGNSYDENKAVQANVTVKTNTGEEMDYGLTWDKDLNLSKLTPPYKSTNTPQPNKKQKDGDSKPISLTPIQKKEFKSAIRDLKKIEDLEYALGEAGNVLANILTNGKAEYIEDVENFGYDADEVEQYAMDLAGGSKLNEGSDTYPFQADSETIALYDRIANELEGTISMVASKLEIPKSDIRISLDYLYDDLEDNKSKKKGMFIQVKADDAKWDKAWTGNPLIMQTTNDEGVVIPSNPFFGVSIKGNKNPKVRAIYNKALDLDLETLAASENAKIADLVSSEEMKLIAPNTPIVVTGK
jgi:hypothetical protein